jgi:hypothetical protein
MTFFERKKTSSHTAWKVIGGATLAAVVYGLITNFSDIKRYINISRM